MRREIFTFAIVVVAFAGCEVQEPLPIAPQPVQSVAPVPKPDPIPGRIWFLKAIGSSEPAPPGTTAAIAFWKPITEILDSLTFDKDSAPTWKLPSGWSQKSVVEGRSFDLVDQAGNRIEITSSSVPDVAQDELIKTRLNLWRDELGLPLLPESDWTDTSETGIHKSTLTGKTYYLFQFDPETSSGTSATIVGAAVPHPNPVSSN